METDDRIDHYDYILPAELIAGVPAARRDASRLLVVDRQRNTVEHRCFTDLPDLLHPGDLLVMNNTRVVPARLVGLRTATGGKWEGLFLREETSGSWRIIGQTRGKLVPGETITLLPAGGGHGKGDQSQTALLLTLAEKLDDGEWIVRPASDRPTWDLLDQFGTMPLPPYLQRDAASMDWERYQTIYADAPGAVAAPTAGLHFTPEILERCRERGIESARVTLHVGLGTFRPVSAERLSEHQMHHEWCELPGETATAIERTRAAGNRVVAIGTTTVRTLESAAQRGPLKPWQGETNLFIRPPFRFQVTDALLTNFHLPKSTLLVLIATFAGRERMLSVYETAIQERYRFYSYGDSMLIL